MIVLLEFVSSLMNENISCDEDENGPYPVSMQLLEEVKTLLSHSLVEK